MEWRRDFYFCSNSSLFCTLLFFVFGSDPSCHRQKGPSCFMVRSQPSSWSLTKSWFSPATILLLLFFSLNLCYASCERAAHFALSVLTFKLFPLLLSSSHLLPLDSFSLLFTLSLVLPLALSLSPSYFSCSRL